jgi:DNA-binding SARP family transcriptional activator
MIISVSLLGRMHVEDETGAEVQWVLSRPRLLGLLAYLAVEAPDGFTGVDQLCVLLWPEADPAKGRRSLNQLLHVSQKQLGVAMFERRGTQLLRLHPDRVRCDVGVLLRDGGVPESLPSGDCQFMPGFRGPGPDFDRWLDDARARVRRALLTVLNAAAADCLQADMADRATVHASMAVAVDPLDPTAFLTHVEALARLGQLPEVWRAFEDYRARLADDLDLPVPAHVVERVAALCRDSATLAPVLVAVRSPNTTSPKDEESSADEAVLLDHDLDRGVARGPWRTRHLILPAGLAAAVVALLLLRQTIPSAAGDPGSPLSSDAAAPASLASEPVPAAAQPADTPLVNGVRSAGAIRQTVRDAPDTVSIR